MLYVAVSLIIHETDEHLFRQVSTCTGHYQLPIFHCTNVHPKIGSPTILMTSWAITRSQQKVCDYNFDYELCELIGFYKIIETNTGCELFYLTVLRQTITDKIKPFKMERFVWKHSCLMRVPFTDLVIVCSLYLRKLTTLLAQTLYLFCKPNWN